ncbi:MAG: hypothetical protein ABJN42_09065, partial [Roseibium sp.]|uniref:hypothetical protein n=1 Tax=Roseibium sp. TaxID=1936156 RepID=UPI0032992A6F
YSDGKCCYVLRHDVLLRFDTSSNEHSASPNYRPGLRLTQTAALKDREFPYTPAALKAVSKFAR